MFDQVVRRWIDHTATKTAQWSSQALAVDNVGRLVYIELSAANAINSLSLVLHMARPPPSLTCSLPSQALHNSLWI